jgi:hypothetical protein
VYRLSSADEKSGENTLGIILSFTKRLDAGRGVRVGGISGVGIGVGVGLGVAEG